MRRLDLTTKSDRENYNVNLYYFYSKDMALAQLKANKLTQPFYSLHYNPAENCFLLITRPSNNIENSTYDLYKVILIQIQDNIF